MATMVVMVVVVMPPGGLRFIICIGVWGGWVVGGGNDQERMKGQVCHHSPHPKQKQQQAHQFSRHEHSSTATHNSNKNTAAA